MSEALRINWHRRTVSEPTSPVATEKSLPVQSVNTLQPEVRQYTFREVVTLRPLKDSLRRRWEGFLLWFAPTSEEIHSEL